MDVNKIVPYLKYYFSFGHVCGFGIGNKFFQSLFSKNQEKNYFQCPIEKILDFEGMKKNECTKDLFIELIHSKNFEVQPFISEDENYVCIESFPESKVKEENMPKHTVFVDVLPKQLETLNQIREFFERTIGSVFYLSFPTNSGSEEFKGYGFVCFTEQRDAEKAVQLYGEEGKYEFFQKCSTEFMKKHNSDHPLVTTYNRWNNNKEHREFSCKYGKSCTLTLYRFYKKDMTREIERIRSSMVLQPSKVLYKPGASAVTFLFENKENCKTFVDSHPFFVIDGIECKNSIPMYHDALNHYIRATKKIQAKKDGVFRSPKRSKNPLSEFIRHK